MPRTAALLLAALLPLGCAPPPPAPRSAPPPRYTHSTTTTTTAPAPADHDASAPPPPPQAPPPAAAPPKQAEAAPPPPAPAAPPSQAPAPQEPVAGPSTPPPSQAPKAEPTTPDDTVAARTAPPRLGILVSGMTPELRQHYGVAGEAGVLVTRVEPGSAAERAGVRVGDVLVQVGDERVTSRDNVVQALGAHPGERVRLTVIRQGRMIDLDAYLARPEALREPQPVMPSNPPR